MFNGFIATAQQETTENVFRVIYAVLFSTLLNPLCRSILGFEMTAKAANFPSYISSTVEIFKYNTYRKGSAPSLLKPLQNAKSEFISLYVLSKKDRITITCHISVTVPLTSACSTCQREKV
jgi:hypothetical protein